jgi:hypothetical protein
MEILEGFRVCNRCGMKKDLKNFYKSSKNIVGLSWECRDCLRKRKIDSEGHYKTNKRKAFLAYRKRIFGLSEQDLSDLFISQRGACKICRVAFIIDDYHIDHCHKSGKVRGLLCRRCNTGIGFFDDDTTLLESAIKYLKGVV